MSEKKEITNKKFVLYCVISVVCVLIVAVIVCISFGLSRRRDKSADTTTTIPQITEEESELVDEDDGTEKEISPDSLGYVVLDTIKKVTAYKDGIVALTNTGTVYLSSSEDTTTNKFNYSNPVMLVDNDEVFVFDKNGTDFHLENSEKTICTNEDFKDVIKYGIQAADYRDDVFAIATKSNPNNSYFVVFTKSGDVKAHGYLEKEYITDIKLTQDGKGVVIAAIGSDNAEIYTYYKAIKFDYDDFEYTANFSNEAPVYLYAKSSERIITVTNSFFRIMTYTRSEDENNTVDVILDFGSNTLLAVLADNNSAYITIALAAYGSSDYISLYFYGTDGTLYSVVELNEAYKSIDASDKYVTVDYGNTVEVYSREGEKCGSIRLNTAQTLSTSNSTNVFVLADNYFYELKAKGKYKFAENSSDNNQNYETQVFTIPVTEEDSTLEK